ncbi:MAG TPA: histidine phosphatase family protein [Gaiellales bacterium]|nr:histidine phosphatase family protein [Gaiellales bacterium]
MDASTRFCSPPRSGCRIYLVRHGRTVMNAQVRFRGRLEIPLDDVGRREAWDAAYGLSGAGLSAVYSSPLRRAIEVGNAITSINDVGAVRPLDDLVNLDYGVWEGMTKEESAAHDPAAFARYLNDPELAVCPEGEAVSAAADRVVAALRHIAAEQTPGTSVAAVTHGIMVRLAVLRVAGPTEHDWQFAMPTASAVIFDVVNGRIKLARPLDRSDPDPRKSGTYLFQRSTLEAAS